MNTQEMSQEIKNTLDATQKIVDGMKDGDRMQVGVLAKEVSALVGKSPSDVLDFVTYFAHNSKVAYITRGKKGGVVKGTKPAPKPVKVKVVVPVAPSVDYSEDSTESV